MYSQSDSFHSQITQLKIDNNPFAKGFRDTGAAASKLDKYVFKLLLCHNYFLIYHTNWIKLLRFQVRNLFTNYVLQFFMIGYYKQITIGDKKRFICNV